MGLLWGDEKDLQLPPWCDNKRDMKIFACLFGMLGAGALLAGAWGCASRQAAEPVEEVEASVELQQNMTRRMLNPVMGSPERLKRAGIPDIRRMAIEAVAIPSEFGLGTTRRLDVALSISNRGRQAVNLWFPDAQRIEILVKNEEGEVLSRWSDDRSFTQATGYLVINPNESVTYTETISTREMRAGRPAIIEASVAGYPELVSTVRVIPGP